MANYEQRADQAIEDRRWGEAASYLKKGIMAADDLGQETRLNLREISLPLYRDVANYREGQPSQLSDADIREIEERTIFLLRGLRGRFTRLYPQDKATLADKLDNRQRYIGILAEASIFGFCVRARAAQLDEVLAVPSLEKHDHGGAQAHDLQVFYPQNSDGTEEAFRAQTKHRVTLDMLTRYDPDVVLLGYVGEDGVDRCPVGSVRSLSRRLCAEGKRPDDREQLDNAYFRIRDRLQNWPEHRAEMLASFALENEAQFNTDSL
jgi:hypothetical protein